MEDRKTPSANCESDAVCHVANVLQTQEALLLIGMHLIAIAALKVFDKLSVPVFFPSNMNQRSNPSPFFFFLSSC